MPLDVPYINNILMEERSLIFLFMYLKYKNILGLQQCLYLNFYLSITWTLVVGWFLYYKLHLLEIQTMYQSTTVYVLLTITECLRLYCGHSGNLAFNVPELAGFLMLSILMEIPLVSFFLFNSSLQSTPTEIILHALLGSVTLIEIVYSFLVLRQMSSVAKQTLFNPNIG